jgi:hypothetical protein
LQICKRFDPPGNREARTMAFSTHPLPPVYSSFPVPCLPPVSRSLSPSPLVWGEPFSAEAPQLSSAQAPVLVFNTKENTVAHAHTHKDVDAQASMEG